MGRLAIEDVHPVVDETGRFPAKAVVGEHVPLRATVWREGHEAVAAAVVWRGPSGGPASTVPMTLVNAGLDRWEAVVVPDREGVWTFRVDAWADPWATWRAAVEAKAGAGLSAGALANDVESGARLLERQARQVRVRVTRERLRAAAARLRDPSLGLQERLEGVRSPEVARSFETDPLRELRTRGRVHRLRVDRPRALAGAWYELFPRSTGGFGEDGKPRHGTFVTAARELPRIAAMGFDVVYLPPIHPIGEVNRKGRDNALRAGPGDVGSPWAVGSRHGGHDAVHPELGTLADFDAFVAAAREAGLEIALDLALQCAPDHPWVREHPEWFTHRPDGSIAHAENPPKSYEDIHPINFDNDPQGLYAEILRIVRFWAARGVRIFRVDNPHTKPPNFWPWLIETVKGTDPDVLFLAEAFTRPPVLHGLAKAGFTQSYTYFTWRTGKQELVDYMTELVASAHYLRPNFFTNTPDILPGHLANAAPPAFAIRAALAATLSPSWGVYSGFELGENEPVRPGSEEYAHSEKYELRPRDYTADPGGLVAWITALNGVRATHPALGQLRTLTFHEVDDDALLAYSKTDPASGDTVLCVVSLDPAATRRGTLRPDLGALGAAAGTKAEDLLSGAGIVLGPEVPVELDPRHAVAQVFSWSRP
ncbi:maltotransferase domain-containing protein [Streptomyces hoynatensis]|nr:maltotransferase domain-containing protein [Streptomyces hoynatensis]